MGLDATCIARVGARSSRGKAHLDSEELIFRGDFRLAIPFREIRSATARGGELHIDHRGEKITLSLGDAAARWADKITHPKSRLEKLGVKRGMRVSLLGVDDPGFIRELREQGVELSEDRPARDADLIFAAISSREALGRLRSLRGGLKRGGAIWTLREKGSAKVTQSEVLTAGRTAGLVDIKVVRFSPTHTAEKFVLPLKGR